MDTYEQLTTKNEKQCTDLMITEYNALESIREKASTERTNRGNFFLAIVYGSLIALGVLATSSLPSDTRAAVALGILATLVIVGLSSFNQSAVSNYRVIWYTRGLNRIRRYFVQLEPDIKGYLMLPTNDDYPPFQVAVGDICQLITVINSALLFALTAGTLQMFTPFPTYLVVILGGLVLVGSYLGQQLRSAQLAQEYARRTVIKFCAPTAAASTSEPPCDLTGGSGNESE